MTRFWSKNRWLVRKLQEVTEQIVNSQTTRDYDYDRSIRYQRNATGVLTRLSAAVVVNELAANRSIVQEDGSETFVPILSEERLESLIQGAVGYSVNRGDSVAVSISPFLTEEIIEIFIPWYENEEIRYWARIVLIFATLVAFSNDRGKAACWKIGWRSGNGSYVRCEAN